MNGVISMSTLVAEGEYQDIVDFLNHENQTFEESVKLLRVFASIHANKSFIAKILTSC